MIVDKNFRKSGMRYSDVRNANFFVIFHMILAKTFVKINLN